MEWVRRGRAWVFGDNIVGDNCVGADTFQKHITDPEVLKQRFMAYYDPEFPQKVQPGDFLIAGSNFGAGRTHREFYVAFRAVGLSGIIADSIQRAVFRSAAEREAVFVMSCPGVSRAVQNGDTLEVDFRSGELRDLTNGTVLHGDPITGPMAELYEAGGMIPLLKKKIAEGKAEAEIYAG